MPLYEYRCKTCDHQFEIQQAFTDDALTTCPECEGALKKVFSPVGISFKGSGFYKNDSRGSSTSTTPAGSSESTSSSSTSSSSEGSSSSSSSSTTPAAATSGSD
ncbi:MAG: FmdB family transcriptional regulator [Actinomycetota bacterium]|nr:FmdB family transcriptional regulator [Actinomycetota bacterium]